MEDLDHAGGIPAVLKQLKELLKPNPTVSGRDILAIADAAVVMDPEVIRPMAKAYHKQGALRFSRATLLLMARWSSRRRSQKT